MIIVITIAVLLLVFFGFVVIRGAPYVPSHANEVQGAFEELYTLGPHDTLVDVGSGDGVVLRIAASRGSRAIGYEINPLLVIVSWILARGNPLIHTELSDFWHKDLPADVTIVYVFAASRFMSRLSQKMQAESDRLGKQLHLITYGAPLKDKQPTKKRRGHHLYVFTPLQNLEA